MQPRRVTTDLHVPRPPLLRQPATPALNKWRHPAGHRRTRWKQSTKRRKKYLRYWQTLSTNSGITIKINCVPTVLVFLYTLSVTSKIEFKICFLAFKVLNDHDPYSINHIYFVSILPHWFLISDRRTCGSQIEWEKKRLCLWDLAFRGRFQ